MSPAYSSKQSSSRKKNKTSFGSRTDIGSIRSHNEDSLVVSPPLFAVADGMGGHAAGEVASEIAVTVLAETAPMHADAEALGDSFIEANRAVMRAAKEGASREGMGTTLTAALIEGERLVIAQVGDSRAYLVHQGKLQQITRDHSLMADMIEAGQLTEAEARTHPNRSVITRALGSDPHMVADLYEINVEPGDRLLICSDGLSSMITDDEIEDSLNRVKDPQRCANMLVSQAIAAGGHDNVTVIVVDIEGYGELRQKKSARKVKASVIVIILLLLAVIGSAAGGFYYYADTTAYLISENGKVAVYRGLPGSILGINASELDHVTNINVEDLQPGVASRLEKGIQVDNLEAADALIEEYQSEADAKRAVDALQRNAADASQSTTDANYDTTDPSTEVNNAGELKPSDEAG